MWRWANRGQERFFQDISMHYVASATVHYACSADRARVVLNSRDTVLAQHDNLNSRTETAWGGQHLQEGWRAWKVAQVYKSGFIAIVATPSQWPRPCFLFRREVSTDKEGFH